MCPSIDYSLLIISPERLTKFKIYLHVSGLGQVKDINEIRLLIDCSLLSLVKGTRHETAYLIPVSLRITTVLPRILLFNKASNIWKDQLLQLRQAAANPTHLTYLIYCTLPVSPGAGCRVTDDGDPGGN